MPDGGTTGQIIVRTSTGYAWGPASTGGGLTTDQVNNLIAPWARASTSSRVPYNKLPDDVADEDYVNNAVTVHNGTTNAHAHLRSQIPSPSNTAPENVVSTAAAVGTSDLYAREDHVHKTAAGAGGGVSQSDVDTSITTHNEAEDAHPDLITHSEGRAIHHNDSTRGLIRIGNTDETVTNPDDYWQLNPIEAYGSELIVRGDKSPRNAIRVVIDNRNYTYSADYVFVIRNFSNRSIQEFSVANGQGSGLVIGNVPHIEIGETAVVQVETGGTGNSQNGVAVKVKVLDPPAYDPTLVNEQIAFLTDEANTSRRALVLNTPDHILPRSMTAPGSSDQVWQLYFGDPGVFDVFIPAYTYGSNIASSAVSDFTVTVTHVSVLNNRTQMARYTGQLDNREAHVPEMWIPAFEFEGRGGSNNEHISIAIVEQEQGGFLASTVTAFPIYLYDHGTIHPVGGWSYADTDDKLPLDKLPEIPDQLPARTAATAGQVLGLASDKSLAWRDSRRAVLAYQGAIVARPNVRTGLAGILEGRVSQDTLQTADAWQSFEFRGGVNWEPDDILELRLSSTLAATLPLYTVTGQGDTTLYPPSDAAIYDYGHSPNPTNRRAADAIVVTATTYNWWILDNDGNWLNGAGNRGGAGNAHYPIWTPTIPETTDGEWAKATAVFRVNHVNHGRFYVFTQWLGQANEHNWATVTAQPGNLQLTVILHKKN